MTKFNEMVMQGTRASQPSAGIPGRVYFVTDEGVIEYDNGSTWGEWTAGGGISIEWAESTTTGGEDYNRSTTGSFTRLTGLIHTFRPLKITAVYWDVRISGTYTLAITKGNTTTPIKTITASKVCSGASEEEFIPDEGDFILHPGLHPFTLSTGSGVLWWDVNAGTAVNALWWSQMVYYDSSSYTSYQVPLKIEAYEGTYIYG